MTKYIGLGQDCNVAEIMNRGGLRDFSLPFDWMFAFPCDIKDSLDKDFSDWLDPEYLEVLNHEMGHFSTRHINYDSHTSEMNKAHNYKLTHAFFNHHNLLDQEDRDAFQRRIDRYREILSSEEDVVFVTNSSPESFEEVGLDTYFDNRPNKTTIVYLFKVGTAKNMAKLSIEDGKFIIKYQETSSHNDTISKIICEILVENFGGI